VGAGPEHAGELAGLLERAAGGRAGLRGGTLLFAFDIDGIAAEVVAEEAGEFAGSLLGDGRGLVAGERLRGGRRLLLRP
jgi:hypothetical protein